MYVLLGSASLQKGLSRTCHVRTADPRHVRVDNEHSTSPRNLSDSLARAELVSLLRDEVLRRGNAAEDQTLCCSTGHDSQPGSI